MNRYGPNFFYDYARLRGLIPGHRPRPVIYKLTPREEELWRKGGLLAMVRLRRRASRLPKRITPEAEAQYRRAMRPGAEILNAAAKGNEKAREIVKLATDRSPASGGQRRRLGGTVGVLTLLPRPTLKRPR